MKAFLTILKKELKRIFTDRRILTSLFMPGILIYVLYSIMGGTFSSIMGPKETYEFNVTVVNQPEELKIALTDNETFKFNCIDYVSEEECFNKIKDKTLDAYIKYDENFITKLNEYIALNQEQKIGIAAPKVEIFFNSSNDNSTTFYSYYSSVLDSYETSISNAFDLNPNNQIQYDLADSNDIGKMVMQMILPMILLMFLATGAMAISPDCIAGEKERGTIATLLITPANRTSIALGKICALSIAGLSSALVSTLGLILSLPKLMGGASGVDISVTLEFSTCLQLGVVIISTSLLFTVIFGVISTISKSVKEASSLSSIPMLLVTVLGVVSAFGTSANTNTLLYLIPFYNSAQCINGLLGQGFSSINVLITFLVNIGFTVLLGFIMAKLFNKERVMFNK